MRKMGLALGALLVSANCFAASLADVSTAIKSNSTNQMNSSTKGSSTFIYGGQDISRDVIATANESLWSGDQGFTG